MHFKHIIQCHHRTDHIDQFAHVAGPRVGAQGSQCSVTEAAKTLAIFLGKTQQQFIGDQQHIIATAAQRRHFDGHHVKAVEQVFAKLTSANPQAQVPVRCTHYAHIDNPRLVFAQALDFAGLQHTQQFGLRRQIQLGNLVQEQCALVGFLENPWAVGIGSGKRPFHVAKQLTFNQLPGYRSTVQGDQFFVPAGAAGVNCQRHQFLARSRLT